MKKRTAIYKAISPKTVPNRNYYIQISKTADSANVLTEASRLGDDCAFMEYDASGSIRYYRNNALYRYFRGNLLLSGHRRRVMG